MFVRVTLVALAIALLPAASAEAQLFRRFFNPAPSQGYRPPTQPYNQTYAQPNAGADGAHGQQQAAPQRYYRLPNGQVVMAPAGPQDDRSPADPNRQPGQQIQGQRKPTTSPQTDIARRSTQANEPQLRGPQNQGSKANRIVGAAQANSANPAQQQPQAYRPQQYRRVVVYNPRTGQRSTRLVPVPATNVASQSPAAAQQARGRNTVAGKLTSPGPTPAIAAAPQPAIRLDSKVSPATFDTPAGQAITLDGPVTSSAVVQPEPSIVMPPVEPTVAVAPQRADGQFSILDQGDEEESLELEAPAN